MEYRKCLLFLFMVTIVSCDICGEDLHTIFTNDVRCKADYNDTFSARIDKDASNILIPSENPSCVTSNIISFGSKGILQVKVYSQSVTADDYLTLLVYDAEENLISQTSLLDTENKANGWSVIELILEGKLQYEGYIMLIGKVSSNSEIMLKSICYLPAKQNSISEDSKTSQNNQDKSAFVETGSIERFSFLDSDFWTPVTISLAVIIPVTILVLISWACFALGKRQGAKQQTQVYEDIENLPKPYLVPRVKCVYTESITESYGGRNNNIYSV